MSSTSYDPTIMQEACRNIFSVTDPTAILANPVRPFVPMTTRSMRFCCSILSTSSRISPWQTITSWLRPVSSPLAIKSFSTSRTSRYAKSVAFLGSLRTCQGKARRGDHVHQIEFRTKMAGYGSRVMKGLYGGR